MEELNIHYRDIANECMEGVQIVAVKLALNRSQKCSYILNIFS